MNSIRKSYVDAREWIDIISYPLIAIATFGLWSMFFFSESNYFLSTLFISSITFVAYLIAYKYISPWIIEISSVKRLMFSVVAFTLIFSMTLIVVFEFHILNYPFPFNHFHFPSTFLIGLLVVIGMTIYVTALSLHMVINTLSLTLESYELLDISYKKEIEMLKMQINPHFISNALNNLNSLIRDKNKQNALNYCQELLNLTNIQLNGSNISGIPIFEEIDWLVRYLKMEQRRLNHNFEYEIIVENQKIIEQEIPPMLIQPIIENSIFHGFNPSLYNKKGIIKISIYNKKLGAINIKIEDNGLGNKAKSVKNKRDRNSISTENILKRIELINQLGIHYIQKKTILHQNGAIIELTISQAML